MGKITYKQQAWILYLILSALGFLAISVLACSREEIPDPVENTVNTETGKTMFCYNKHDESESYCIRNLNTKLGSAIECSDKWYYLYYWNHLARVEVGNKQFVFYHNRGGLDNKSWMITEMLATGQMGAITDGGEADQSTWANNYETLLGFHVGSRGFIFGQDSYDDHPWFVQEITGQGKLGSETDHGTWHNYYKSATPMYVNSETFLINGNAASWSSFSRPALGNMTSGGGAAIGNIDKDETMDLLLMTIDDPYGND